MDNWDDLLFTDVEQVQLRKLKVGLEQHIAPILLSSTVEVTSDDPITRMIVVRILGKIWSEDLQNVTVSYPNSWWDAFKRECFPKWALQRWPARYTDVTVDVRAVYPKLRMETPYDTTYVIQTQTTERARNIK